MAKKRNEWEELEEFDPPGRGPTGDLADLFGEDWTPESHHAATQSPEVLPEPMVVPREEERPGRRVPIPARAGDEDPEETTARMRAGAEALGVEVQYEARIGGAGTDVFDQWQEALDHYQKVIQEKMRGAEDGEDLRLTLTTDPEIEAADKRKIAHLIRDAFLEHDAGRGVAFEQIVNALYDEMVGLSVLAPLWRDSTVTEILVDGWETVYVERSGRLEPTNVKFRGPEHLETVARKLAEVVSDRGLSKTSPLVTARLPDSRVAFVYGDVAGDGVYVTIRKHHEKLTWEQLLSWGALTEEMYDFLRKAVQARVNILISGGTGAGKTTIINAVSSFIPDDERVITIEDSYELELRNRYWARLQAKARASADDKVEISVSDLLVQTLRMRPDRIVVGEVRDGAAAATLLEAANTGHDGTLTTLHANSGWDAINSRLPGLHQAHTGSPRDMSKAEVARAFELVVHVARRRGKRFIAEISEVGHYDHASGQIFLRKLFEGHLGEEGNVVFRQLAWPMVDGDLARKFDEEGIDIPVGNLEVEEPANPLEVQAEPTEEKFSGDDAIGEEREYRP